MTFDYMDISGGKLEVLTELNSIGVRKSRVIVSDDVFTKLLAL